MPPTSVDSFDFLFRHTGAAVHNDGRAGNALLNFLGHIEVQTLCAFELVSAVAGADGRGQRVAASLPNEFYRLLRIGETGVFLVDLDVFLNTAKHAEFGFDTLIPFACAGSTTRLVIATLFAKDS